MPSAKGTWRPVDMAYIALFAVLLTVCAWISVPLPVPFTLQTFAIFAALGILGGRRGTWAVAVYLLLGAVGLPVFSGFRGGLGALLGTTGGYILGFLALALEKIEKVLSPEEYRLLKRLVFDGASHLQVAREFHITVYASEKRLERIRDKLSAVFPGRRRKKRKKVEKDCQESS